MIMEPDKTFALLLLHFSVVRYYFRTSVFCCLLHTAVQEHCSFFSGYSYSSLLIPMCFLKLFHRLNIHLFIFKAICARTCLEFSNVNAGRFANQAIAFIIFHEAAKILGMPLCIGLRESQMFSPYPNILQLYNSTENDLSIKISPLKLGCGPYYQNYNLLQDLRPTARFLFTPSDMIRSETTKYSIQDDDLVIHYRFYEVDHRAFAFVPLEYFTQIIHHHKKKKNLRQIYVACEPSLVKSDVVSTLISRYNATYIDVSFHAQIQILTRAKNLVLSLGSLSAYLAFMSEGCEIHIPFYSNIPDGSSWYSASELFIQDDERIYFHDLNNSRDFIGVNARHAISLPTRFASAVLHRKNCIWALFREILRNLTMSNT